MICQNRIAGMSHVLAALIAAALTAACTTPLQQPGPGKVVIDRDTSYAVEERSGGFTLHLAYDRYQFVPEFGAVLTACRSALLAAAHDVAEKRNRSIEQVNEQRIKISTGRNIVSGITSCEASVPVEWKR